jgi:hypothetical protein
MAASTQKQLFRMLNSSREDDSASPPVRQSYDQMTRCKRKHLISLLLLTEPEGLRAAPEHHAFGILYPAVEVSPYSLAFEFGRIARSFVMLRPTGLEKR